MLIDEKLLREVVRKALLEKISLKFGFKGERTKTKDDGSNLAGEEWLPKQGSKGEMKGKPITGPAGLDEYALPYLKKFFTALMNKGYSINVTSVFRTRAKQASLTSGAGQDVAKSGKSPHQYGLGIDINIEWKGRDDQAHALRLKSSNEDWEKVVKNDETGVDYEKYNLRWGGIFKKRDAVHFDVTGHPEFRAIRNNKKLAGKSLGSKLKSAADKVADKEAIMWTDLKQKWVKSK